MRRNDPKSWLFRGSTCLYCSTKLQANFPEKPSAAVMRDRHLSEKQSLCCDLSNSFDFTNRKTTPTHGRGSLPAFQVERGVGSPRTPHIPRCALPFCSPLRTSTLKVSWTVPTDGVFPYDQIPASQKESIKICLQDYDFKVRLYFSIFLSVANPQTYENSLKTNLQCFYWKKAIGKALTHWAAGNFAAEGLV